MTTKKIDAQSSKKSSIAPIDLLSRIANLDPTILNSIIIGILDKLPGGFIVLDKKWRLIYLNSQAKKFVKDKDTQLVGENIWEMMSEEQKNEFYPVFNTATKSTVAVITEVYDEPSNSWYEVRLFPTPLGLAVYFEEITQRKKSEEALYQLATIFDSSDDAIISKNLQGIVMNWNKGAERLLGYTSQEMIGSSINKVLPDGSETEELEILEVIRMGESIENYDTIRKAKNGKLIDVSISISPIRDTKGKIIGASSISRDITSYKELERRKDDFIGMASHELRTPITSLKAFNQLLLKMFSDKEHEKVNYYLQKMDDQLDKLVNLISDLLDISKIQAGKLELRKEKFDMNELVRETVETIQGTVERHKITIKGQAKSKLLGDRDRLSQVLINLITNAVKYSPNAKRVCITIQEEANTLTIGVQDFGIGIKREHQDKLFDRFFRVEGANEKTFPGLGVGLFISSEIAKRHGGSISVNSKKGEGSIFYLHLPLR